MKKMQRSRGKQTSKSWKRRQQLNLNCLNVWQQIQWRIQGRGARGLGPTLFLDQTEAAGPKGRKNFFWRPPRPLSQGLDPALKSTHFSKHFLYVIVRYVNHHISPIVITSQ